MRNKDNKWLVLVNLHAGTNKGKRDWPEIHDLLLKTGFEMQIVFTGHAGHAIRITQKSIEEEGFTNILVVGGDGTFNEVANGIFSQKKHKTTDITLGMITVGTGNDWGRMYDMPEEYSEQIKIIQKAKTFVQDVGVVKYQSRQNRANRYFVNIAGMGYDALVTHKTNRMKRKGKGGALVYLFNLLRALFQYKVTQLEIEADGKKVFSGKIFSMSIGICKFNGAGMMQLPYAIADDGLLDVTVIRKTSKIKVIRNIKNLYDGSFIQMKEVETFRGEKFTIRSEPAHELYLETDGESLGNSPLDFEIIPKAIKLIVK
ncbi:MAG: diacylglycerol kinase family lipid kinase [Bacteroidales bacterium]|nr:diacylglycerol kinase family lipid kinase [Bacteroidales bacterium]